MTGCTELQRFKILVVGASKTQVKLGSIEEFLQGLSGNFDTHLNCQNHVQKTLFSHNNNTKWRTYTEKKPLIPRLAEQVISKVEVQTCTAGKAPESPIKVYI